MGCCDNFAMARLPLAALVGCVLAAPAAAQPRQAPRRLLDAPVFTIRPQGALSAFVGEGVNVNIAWRAVAQAARYRITLTAPDNTATEVEVRSVAFETKGLAPGRYQLTVTAIDVGGIEGAISEPLPLNVIEVRAVPPGADGPMPPTRGAYAVGTRFSVPAMHCEATNAPIDDLLVLPENELRVTKPGLTTLRCAGIPGYLEKQVVIAPITIAARSTDVPRGAGTIVHVTFASVAYIGERLDVQALGDITLGDVERTKFGIDVPIAAPLAAKSAGLEIHSGSYELGKVELQLVAPPAPPPPPPRPPLHWALDFGGQVGAFFPPSSATHATALGHPVNPADIVTAGPLAGARLGLFPIARVGLEGEISIGAGGYADESGIAQILATRAQLAVRVIEAGRVGLRLFGGAGALTTLRDRGSSQQSASGEVHAGGALTLETAPNLWLRFQLSDLVTSARDGGYAHVLEAQLGIFTRFGRRDSF